MQKRTKDILVAAVAVTAALVSLYFAFVGRSQKINLDTYEVLGAVTAEETAKLLGGIGKALVIVRDTGPDKNPSVEAELKAFQKTINKHGVRAITEKIPITPMLMMATGGGIPPDQLFKALETHSNVNALVLFLGFPPLAGGEVEALKKFRVKTIVVSSMRPGYEQLLEQQAIQMAIVPRADGPVPDAKEPRTVRERFDLDYTIITSADAAQLR